MEEKVALVTDSATGIGLACAQAFAKAGYITVLADINEPEEQAESLVKEGYKAVAYRCDVSDTKAVKGIKVSLSTPLPTARRGCACSSTCAPMCWWQTS